MRDRRSYSRFLVFAALVSGILLCANSGALAQRKTIGNFSDWTAFVDGTGANRICYIGSVPKQAKGNYTRRGDTYILVSHRPTERVFGEVSIEAGYTYKKDSQVAVDVDGKTFKLFTKGGNAWADDADSDKALVAAMRAGRRLIAKGTSSRGTLTTDTYSLSGFTLAFNAIKKACSAP